MTTQEITKTFCKATKTLMALGMTEADAKAKTVEIMNQAIDIMKGE
jgi:hypothetical protein